MTLKLSTKIILIIFITSILFACKKNNNQAKLLSNLELQEPIPLSGETLKNDSIIWAGRLLYYIDNNLIFQCWDCNEYDYYVYEIKDSLLLQKGTFLRKGQGPYEMTNSNIYYDKMSNMLYIYNDAAKPINCYSVKLSPFSSIYKNMNWNKISIPVIDNSFISKIVALNDTLFVGIGGSFKEDVNSLTTLISVNGLFKGMNVPLPDDGVKVSSFVKKSIYRDQGHIMYNKKKNKLYYDIGLGGLYAKIISLNEKYEVIDVKDILDELPDYAARPDGINIKYNNGQYMEPYSTDNNIYILPSPNKLVQYNKYKGYPDNYNDEIYVFDWEGKSICKYKLEIPVLMFVVDNKDKYLYGSTINLNNGEYYVIRYKLPK